MNSFLWAFAVLCGLVCLFTRYASSGAIRQTLEQRQRQFIVDVCDGNQQQAERLIQEKMQAHPGVETSEVLQLVYQDMLDLTAEERAAAHVIRRGYAGKGIVKGSAA
ncbi:hypothetical protein hmeg3_07890 [Herbaspirillum sp. meg3]|jgi:hypothetical protein|uniref:hypothetical protein n=1 Tax=Herbaspirillum sp. meg3 TaxID=2025949 RepID=UPI000B997F37|nr:hypothetical protein [Herbaspirillum sp. meg3]ASU38223.1 hypothetical protein hmeg3_07890 [Herbaspirillum sp. meg3]